MNRPCSTFRSYRYTYIRYFTIPCYTSFWSGNVVWTLTVWWWSCVTFILHLINTQLDSALTYPVFAGRGRIYIKMYRRYTQALILYNVCVVVQFRTVTTVTLFDHRSIHTLQLITPCHISLWRGDVIYSHCVWILHTNEEDVESLYCWWRSWHTTKSNIRT